MNNYIEFKIICDKKIFYSINVDPNNTLEDIFYRYVDGERIKMIDILSEDKTHWLTITPNDLKPLIYRG